MIDVRQVYNQGQEGIQLFIPRTNKSREGLPGPTKFNTSDIFGPDYAKTQYMMHVMEVGEIHVDSAITIEFFPENLNSPYVLLFDHERIPTYNEFENVAFVSTQEMSTTNNSEISWNSDDDFYEWFLTNDAVANRTGRFFITIATLKQGENISLSEMENKQFDKAKIDKFSVSTFFQIFYLLVVYNIVCNFGQCCSNNGSYCIFRVITA